MELQNRLTKIKTRLMLQAPQYGALLLGTRINIADTHPIAWADGFEIYLNPEQIDKITDDELVFILLHEVYHNLKLHIPRCQNRKPFVWNVAADIDINNSLVEEAQHFSFISKVPPFNGYVNPQMKGKSVEEIYDLIVDDFPEDPQLMVDLYPQDYTEGLENGYELEQKIKAQEQFAKELLSQAVKIGQDVGKLPASIERMFKALIRPRVDYRSILNNYVSSLNITNSWARPSRRSYHLGVYLPSQKSEYLNITVVVDASGSISDEELQVIFADVYSIMTMYDSVKCTFIVHDTEIRYKEEITAATLLPESLEAGGGTNFNCVLKDLAEDKPEILFWFTDLDGHFSKKYRPDYPVVFICNTDKPGPDWATEVVRV